jgi:subtilase family serine protease
MPVTGISFRFRPTSAQQAELDRLLEDQQDSRSPSYHAWLTPEEYGDRFGLSSGDYAKVSDWVDAQGFQVDDTARSRTWITFSGTAAQVRKAFLTDVHRFQVKGKAHYANVDDVALPKELEPLVYEVRGLDDFHSEREVEPRRLANFEKSGHGVGPADLAVIYNSVPLWEMGITGAGQKIVVVGQSSFPMSEVQDFRRVLELPKNDPQMILVPGSLDPGVTGDVEEALLDVQYAGGSAPNATVLYVYAPSVLRAAEYAVDRNLAPVISESYGVCEDNVALVNGAAATFRNMAQQANAQGITWIASAGDSGPSGCQHWTVDTEGRSISAIVSASVPEVTAVGGTRFDEKPGVEYWNSKEGPGKASARSYIPEKAWNDTDVKGTLAASGGGTSALYPKPVWQTAPGVPNGNMRHVPDISFTASWFHDPYMVFIDGVIKAGGGTSAGTPFFAGVVAMLNQHVMASGAQSKPGLGNVNPRLYELAQAAPSVFHDITAGDTIIPCKTGTPGCTAGKYGFKAGPGYDLTTGLGSIDVKNLFDNWIESKGLSGVSTTLTLTATPTTLATNSSAVLTATVKAASGTATPSGSVTFKLGQTALGSANLLGSGLIATATFSVAGKQLAPGANAITASYSGAGGFQASSGTAVITVSGQPSGSVVVPTVDPNPVMQREPDEDGYEWYYTVQLKETAGVPTKVTAFSVDGYDLSAQIADWFGTANLPADGTISVAMRSYEVDVPTDVVFKFGGVDGNGQRWSKQISVPFLGKKETTSGPGAAISLVSVPESVVKSGKGDPNCAPERPYYQKLVLQESNGQEVQLTKFVAGGTDYTNQIAAWFGSERLPAKGTLTAGLCWQLDRVPVTIQYQMDGVDKSGKPVQAALSVYFWSLDSKSGDPDLESALYRRLKRSIVAPEPSQDRSPRRISKQP